ncbi:MAG: class I SAM-dependent methyltransferase [Syntrophales bacterium]|nr:class I SAM-dependent methyltransferase [Syntrophales bacterium]
MVMKLFRKLRAGRHPDLDHDAGRYWSMSDINERIRDQSHWYGEGRWEKERWLAYGDFFFDLAGKRLRQAVGPDWREGLKTKTALDWGCGGGAIARLLCEHFASVYGMDISAATLYECRKRMADLAAHQADKGRAEVGNFTAFHFPSEYPEAVLDLITPGTVDFIVSVGVFKHFPSQAYTLRVLQIMEKLLKKEGFLFIQIRYFDGEEKYRPKEEDYARNVITMTSFTADVFAAQLAAAGLALLHRERDIDGEDEKHEYYFLGKGI